MRIQTHSYHRLKTTGFLFKDYARILKDHIVNAEEFLEIDLTKAGVSYLYPERLKLESDFLIETL